MTTTARGRPSWIAPFVIALALRLWGLGEVPTTLTIDEAHLGYEAWSIVRAVGQGHAPQSGEVGPCPLGTYAVALSVGLFGPTPIAVRLPFALAGSLSVVPLAVIGEALIGTRVAGAAAALLLATSPWHLAFTRVARDGTWLVFGLILMVAGLIGVGARARRRGWLPPVGLTVVGAAIATIGDPIGAIAAGTTAIAVGFSLAAARPPIVLPGRKLLQRGMSNHIRAYAEDESFPSQGERAGTSSPSRRLARGEGVAARVAAALLTVAVLVAPYAAVPGAIPFGPEREARAEAEATSAKRLAADSSGITGVFQESWAVLGRAALAAYASHLDLTFLTTRGDADKRNHPTGFGQLSLIDLPLVVAGALLALQAGWSRRPSGVEAPRWGVVIAWLAVAPLPAAIAVSNADATRSIGMVPALALLEAGAIAAVWPRVVARRVTFEARLVVGVTTVAWALATAVHDPVEAGRAFGAGAFAGFEWARMEVEAGRAAQVVVVSDASQAVEAARLALRVDPLARVQATTLAGRRDDERVDVREVVDWANERREASAASRLYALHGAARVPEGFAVAHVAKTGDGRPIVTFVRVSP